MSISKKHLLVSSLIIVFTVSSILFFAKSERGVGEPKHIFIFMTESTRADHLQCYGYERNTTPNICNLAEDGVLFENTYAQSSVTHVSLPSILTSKSPIHGLQNWTLSLNDNYTTFPETLSNHGFRNYYEGLLSNSNFDQGFIDGLDIIQRQKKLFKSDRR